jgi:hypothetical protein
LFVGSKNTCVLYLLFLKSSEVEIFKRNNNEYISNAKKQHSYVLLEVVFSICDQIHLAREGCLGIDKMTHL